MPLSDAVVLVSLAPKSNTAHNAYFAALADVQAGKAGPIPGSCKTSITTGRTRR